MESDPPEGEGLPWLAKVGAVPTLPRPTSEWRDQLVRLLTFLDTQGPVPRDTEFRNPGSKTVYSLGQYADQLASFDLVTRTPDRRIAIGGFGRMWLADPTPTALLRQIHARARFVGELLASLTERTREMSELQDIANDEFGLDWRSRDQVRRRLTWLISLGFAERFYNNHYAITDAGRAILGSLALHSPEALTEEPRAVEIPEPGPAISAALATMAADPEVDQRRHRGLGYVPSGPHSPLEASIRTLVEYGLSDIDAGAFVEKTRNEFDISASSARTALGSLQAVGLLEPTGRTTSVATGLAKEWLRSGAALDLLRVLHVRTFPVGEVIGLIDEAKRAPTLSLLLDETYGKGSTSSLAVNRILPLLLAAGAIREIGHARYASTAFGRALADSLPLRRTATDRAAHSELALATHETARVPEEIVAELRAAGTRSEQPRRLDEAVAEAFRFLGASATVIGGPGNTDVLVEFGIQPSDRIVAIVDAKSAAHGIVNESAVNLNAIEDHRKKHGASLAAIVAPGFGGRLGGWAREKRTALLTTDFLADVVRKHAKTPLGLHELTLLFAIDDAPATLHEVLSTRSRSASLLWMIMTVLLREALRDDPNVAPGLDKEGIYRAIRDQYAVMVDMGELRAALELLASPLVRGIVKQGQAYFAVESQQTVRHRLGSLATAVVDTAAAEAVGQTDSTDLSITTVSSQAN